MEITQELTSLIANELSLPIKSVTSTLNLLIKESCTVPFISRYRKEATGGLDEVQIRNVEESYNKIVELEKRRAFVLETIEKMEKMTPDLKKKILEAKTINVIEDIYAPYKSKRKTKGQLADEAGLLPLAELILTSNNSINEIENSQGKAFLNPEKKINNWEDALTGAKYILIERFSHDTEIKDLLRKRYWEDSKLVSSKKKKAKEVKDWEKFKDYFEFDQSAKQLKDAKNGHRYLALRRGMSLGVLKVDVVFDQETARKVIENKYFPLSKNLGCRQELEDCSKKAISLYIHNSIDLEIKSELKLLADDSAIEVFKENLKNLLLQPYLGSHPVLAIDPGVRTGCKIVAIDKNGNLKDDAVIYPHEPRNQVKESKLIVEALVEKHSIKHIAIGNGTFGRETLHFIEDNLDKVKKGEVKATLISESGASIYSASDIAREEFPDKDVTVRGAVSIGRRFQDPLAELVKIDPKSIGVGQYQHDVNQAKLKRSLGGVVEDCVNHVGVDINTASAPLLSFISGIGPSMAKNIVGHREKVGGFKNRSELLKVARFSDKVFQLSAGFLKIYNGENPLDSTFIHPEQYENLLSWAKSNGINISQLLNDKEKISAFSQDKNLKEKMGNFTHEDVVSNLTSPGQDPRTEFKSTEFRRDIRGIDDLKINEWYNGVVTNITKFGAFVDIGIKENGLLHVSEMADHFVSNPLEELKVGQEVKVKIKEIDHSRKRISLSRKKGETSGPRPASTNKSQKGKKRPSERPKNSGAFAALKDFKVKGK